MVYKPQWREPKKPQTSYEQTLHDEQMAAAVAALQAELKEHLTPNRDKMIRQLQPLDLFQMADAVLVAWIKKRSEQELNDRIDDLYRGEIKAIDILA